MIYTLIRKDTIDNLKDSIGRKQKVITELQDEINSQKIKIAVMQKTIETMKYNERDRHGVYVRNKNKKQTK